MEEQWFVNVFANDLRGSNEMTERRRKGSNRTLGPESASRTMALRFFVTCVSIDRARLNGLTIQ